MFEALVLEHVRQNLGTPKLLSLQEIVPSDPSIAIHAIQIPDGLALITTGISSRPMSVPSGQEAFRLAEVMMFLPTDWPLSLEALKDEQLLADQVVADDGSLSAPERYVAGRPVRSDGRE